MLENKKVNIVISFIVAIALWGYVIGETDPKDTKVYRDIPISYVNEQVLEDSGLAVLSSSASFVNVTLSGSRADINKISPEDIQAVIDLAEAGKGENQLKIDIRGIPDNVEVDDTSINKVTVTIEDRQTKEVSIRPEYQGNFEEEQEAITIDMNRNTVLVSGAVSQVEKVKEVKAVVPAGSVTDHLKTVECSLVPVDAEGIKVINVELSAKTVNVSAELAKTKTVKLNVPIIDNNKDEVKKTLSVPKTVVIKGKAADLADIETIDTEIVDISDVTEDTTLALTPILPKDVQISSKSAGLMKIAITVEQISSRTFDFNSDDIQLEGLDEDLKARIDTKKIQITVRGNESQIGIIKKENFSLSADLKNLEEGNHQVELIVICDKRNTVFSVDPEKISITIEE